MNIAKIATMVTSPILREDATPAERDAVARVRRANARTERVAIIRRAHDRAWIGTAADVISLLAIVSDSCPEYGCQGLEAASRCPACDATRAVLARDTRARQAIADAESDASLLAREARESYASLLARESGDTDLF